MQRLHQNELVFHSGYDIVRRSRNDCSDWSRLESCEWSPVSGVASDATVPRSVTSAGWEMKSGKRQRILGDRGPNRADLEDQSGDVPAAVVVSVLPDGSRPGSGGVRQDTTVKSS